MDNEKTTLIVNFHRAPGEKTINIHELANELRKKDFTVGCVSENQDIPMGAQTERIEELHGAVSFILTDIPVSQISRRALDIESNTEIDTAVDYCMKEYAVLEEKTLSARVNSEVVAHRVWAARNGDEREWSILAADESIEVRAAVAENAKDKKSIDILAGDKEPIVREWLARYGNSYARERLLENGEQNSSVTEVIIKHGEPHLLSKIVQRENSSEYVAAIVEYGTEENIQQILNHTNPKVRGVLAWFGNKEHLEKLLKDPDISELDKAMAKEKLKEIVGDTQKEGTLMEKEEVIKKEKITEKEPNRNTKELFSYADQIYEDMLAKDNGYFDFLSSVSQHPSESVPNQALIFQKELQTGRTLSDLRTYDEWKESENPVRRGEKGFQILKHENKPRDVNKVIKNESGETKTETVKVDNWTSKPIKVFSRSQTVDGAEENNLKLDLSEHIYSILEKSTEFEVQEVAAAPYKSSMSYEDKTITLDAGLSAGEKTGRLVRELCRQNNNGRYNLAAKSAEFVIKNKLNLPHSTDNFTLPKTVGECKDVIRDTIKITRALSGRIDKAIKYIAIMERETSFRDFLENHRGATVDAMTQGGYLHLSGEQTQNYEKILTVPSHAGDTSDTLYKRDFKELLDATIRIDGYDEVKNEYLLLIDEKRNYYLESIRDDNEIDLDRVREDTKEVEKIPDTETPKAADMEKTEAAGKVKGSLKERMEEARNKSERRNADRNQVKEEKQLQQEVQ